MSQDSPAPARRHPTALWAVILVVLLPAVVLPLWVPLYDKTDPTLWGFPFFYWFQFAMILMSAVLTLLAFTLSRVADRRRGGSGR
ncbi:DUF3311 domain-containing protein [Nocardioides cynanchi]|uniref:DUF3311 domain-containing protein n=1 Tax=Nocardioides cynanchi TaxID=2558918 RepID=UPI001244084A|nr:DUF3311 domain-containing protein [Nocardioides cynanchi]